MAESADKISRLFFARTRGSREIDDGDSADTEVVETEDSNKDDSAAYEGIEWNKESEVDSDTDVSVELPAADCGAALLNKLLATC